MNVHAYRLLVEVSIKNFNPEARFVYENEEEAKNDNCTPN